MSTRLGQIASSIRDFINQNQRDIRRQKISLLPIFSELKIHEGYNLDIYHVGEVLGSEYRPYCFKHGSYKIYEPYIEKKLSFWKRILKRFTSLDLKTQYIPYNDELRIIRKLSFSEARTIPNVLQYFEVPFTEEGIMQAWLLRNITKFLPLEWHAAYSYNTHLFNSQTFLEEIELNFQADDEEFYDSHIKGKTEVSQWDKTGYQEEVKRHRNILHQIQSYDLEQLLPRITFEGGEATLEYYFWNDWKGFNKAVVKAKRCRHYIEYRDEEILNIIPYHCGYLF